MRKALVIADDLSGAAEIAGIGRRYGLPTKLARERPKFFPPGLTVIDTDSRSLPPEEAAAAAARAVAGIDPTSFDLIFKKTDSVLRGPIAWEPAGAAEADVVLVGARGLLLLGALAAVLDLDLRRLAGRGRSGRRLGEVGAGPDAGV